jgi:hypothetical protein
MKTININLDITSFTKPNDSEPQDANFPCPRVTIFQPSVEPTNITEAGTYNYTFNLEDDQECTIDFFTWKTGNIKLVTDLPIETGNAGTYLDQIRNTIYVNEAGTYNISARIKGHYKIPLEDRKYTFFNQGGCQMWDTGVLLD